MDEVASLREAHQLAFYIFWNIKPHFQRCALQPWRLTSCSAQAALVAAAAAVQQ